MSDLAGKTVEAQLRAASNREVQLQATLEAISDALEGKPVSEFMASFPLVRRAQEVATRHLTLGVKDLVRLQSLDNEFVRAELDYGDGVVVAATSRRPQWALAHALEILAQELKKEAL